MEPKDAVGETLQTEDRSSVMMEDTEDVLGAQSRSREDRHDESHDHQPAESNTTTTSVFGFFTTFLSAKGALQIVLLSVLLSFGVASTIGIVPEVLTDRYARMYYGYDGPHCSSFDRIHKPQACQHGSDDAQAGMALSTFFQNILTLFCNTTIGSISDARGRRLILLLSTFLYTLSPAVLVWMQLAPDIVPLWYFVSLTVAGFVNWISVGFSMLSDIMPPQYRAAAFGLFVATFYCGFAIGPSLAVIMNHFAVSVLSLALMLAGLLFCGLFVPETLSPQVAERNLAERRRNLNQGNMWLRPIREMTILNQSTFFRLLTVAYFLSGMVYSSDRSLVLVYIEDQLNVRDGDLARMFFIMGLCGVLLQGIFMEVLIKCLGEKGLLVVSFVSGTLHNLLYGVARSKFTIYIALCLSQLTKTNFPLVSSIASNNVGAQDQGRMQGALFALTALANAVGPVLLEWIYSKTKDYEPGTMFVAAALLYAVGTVIVATIPSEKVQGRHGDDEDENDLEEPLLLEAGPDV